MWRSGASPIIRAPSRDLGAEYVKVDYMGFPCNQLQRTQFQHESDYVDHDNVHRRHVERVCALPHFFLTGITVLLVTAQKSNTATPRYLFPTLSDITTPRRTARTAELSYRSLTTPVRRPCRARILYLLLQSKIMSLHTRGHAS